MNVLVIGAGGTLGREVSSILSARGHVAKPVARGASLDDAADGCGAIVNCAGASVAMGLGHGWRGYRAVDVPIGLAAVVAARRTGARLVYVAAHHAPELRRCAYVDAHERVVAAMQDIDGTVVRATGFHAAFAALLPLAKRGWLVDAGDGRAHTNPISERDLAAVVVDALASDIRERSVGGPEVLTRGELFATVAAAAARRVRIARVPVWLARIGSFFLRPLHPRIAQFAHFATLLARFDNVAPQVGTTRLADYLAA
jgi:uncharacterized protein YbjT (DUF2867 family)